MVPQKSQENYRRLRILHTPVAYRCGDFSLDPFPQIRAVEPVNAGQCSDAHCVDHLRLLGCEYTCTAFVASRKDVDAPSCFLNCAVVKFPIYYCSASSANATETSIMHNPVGCSKRPRVRPYLPGLVGVYLVPGGCT